MLPAMAELVPPLALNDLLFINPIHGPQMPLRLIQKDALKNMSLVLHRRFVRAMVLPKLMLIVGAIKRHFDLLRIRGIRVRVVHGSEPGRLAVRARGFVFGKGDLGFLGVVFGARAESGVEAGFVDGGEVVAVGVGDGDVVVEAGAAEDEAFAPGGRFAEEFEGVVGEDGEDEVVEGFGRAGGAGVFAATVAGVGVERAGLEDDAGFGAAGGDGGYVGVEPDIDAFGAEVGGPVFVEAVEVGERDHCGEVGEEGIGVVVPEFHVGVGEKAFEDGAGDVGGLIACRDTVSLLQRWIKDWIREESKWTYQFQGRGRLGEIPSYLQSLC